MTSSARLTRKAAWTDCRSCRKSFSTAASDSEFTSERTRPATRSAKPAADGSPIPFISTCDAMEQHMEDAKLDVCYFGTKRGSLPAGVRGLRRLATPALPHQILSPRNVPKMTYG